MSNSIQQLFQWARFGDTFAEYEALRSEIRKRIRKISDGYIGHVSTMEVQLLESAVGAFDHFDAAYSQILVKERSILALEEAQKARGATSGVGLMCLSGYTIHKEFYREFTFDTSTTSSWYTLKLPEQGRKRTKLSVVHAASCFVEFIVCLNMFVRLRLYSLCDRWRDFLALAAQSNDRIKFRMLLDQTGSDQMHHEQAGNV